jgi:predicted nucleic acid-binding Zn ribbon protein
MFPKNKSPKMLKIYAERMQKALEKYYANPVKCKNCLSVIEVPEGGKPSEIKTRKFCSHACSAKFNNQGKTRHHKGNTCRVCNKLILAQQNFCSKDCREILYSKNKKERVKKSGKYVISWRQRTKLRAVFYKGGCCQICGYDKSVRALQFHHYITGEKDFSISRVSKSWQAIKNELDKCILLCANCHAEVHEGLFSLIRL